jgi:hypothetical protein
LNWPNNGKTLQKIKQQGLINALRRLQHFAPQSNVCDFAQLQCMMIRGSAKKATQVLIWHRVDESPSRGQKSLSPS